MGSEKWIKNEKLTIDEMNSIVNYFYVEDGKELKKICNQILHVIWNDIPGYYKDDFESLAGYIITFCLESYDPTTGPFRAYVYPYMQKKFISYIYEINSLKRGGDGNWDREKRDENGKKIKKSVKVKFVNIDDKIKEGSDSTYADILEGGKSVEDIIFENEKDSKLEAYINRLSKIQKEIVFLMMDGYKPNEIQEELHITNKQYFNYVTEMRTSELRLALEER